MYLVCIRLDSRFKTARNELSAEFSDSGGSNTTSILPKLPNKYVVLGQNLILYGLLVNSIY